MQRLLTFDWIGTRKTDLPKLLAETDYLVMTCDLNDQTEGMIDAAAFAQMKDSAYVINVARGEVMTKTRCSKPCRTSKLPARPSTPGIVTQAIL